VGEGALGFGCHVLALVGGRVRVRVRGSSNDNVRTLLQTQRRDAIFERIPCKLFWKSGMVSGSELARWSIGGESNVNSSDGYHRVCLWGKW
jgi:hypothetical protein